jgi:hypothetical protein
VSLLLLLCGCGGNYSNADLEFLNALPAKDELAAKLPESGASRSGLGADADFGQRRDGLTLGETADYYVSTRDASKSFNEGLDFLLGIIEAVREQPPTSRTPTSRTWGPFPADDQPGFLAQVVIERTSAARYAYRLEFRRDAKGAAWFAILQGAFSASGGVRKGVGELTLDALTARSNGLTTRGLEQLAMLQARYDTQGTPVRVDMALAFTADASAQDANYQYREQADGQGAMRFVIRQSNQTLQLTSRWLATGQGQADAAILAGDFAGASQVECWDAAFLLRYLRRSWESAAQGDPAMCPAAQPWAE